MMGFEQLPSEKTEELVKFLKDVDFPDVPDNLFDAIDFLEGTDNWVFMEDGKILAWFNLSDILDNASACFHVASVPSFTKRWTRSLVREMFTKAFNKYNLYSLWMWTERPNVKKLALSIGFVGGYNGANPNTYVVTRDWAKKFIKD